MANMSLVSPHFSSTKEGQPVMQKEVYPLGENAGSFHAPGYRLRLWLRDKGTSQSPAWFHLPQAQTSSRRLLNTACVSCVHQLELISISRKQNLCYFVNENIYNDILFE